MIRLGDRTITPRRVFCIGRNYAAHARELGNATPGAPVVFMKPVTSLVPDGADLPLPRGLGPVHHEAELVLVLGDGGQVAGVTLGLDLTLRAVQDRLKAERLPWERAKAFEASAPIGTRAVPAAGLDLAALEFELTVGGTRRQHGHTGHLLFPVPVLLASLASQWRLGLGDLVYTGTPEGVGPLEPGDTAVLRADWCGAFHWSCS